MDPIARMVAAGAAGVSGSSGTYVDDLFSTFLYEGTGSSQSLNNGIDLSGEGGLVWLKKRSSTGNHWVFDTERGASSRLLTNTTGSAYTGVTGLSFNSNGFTVNTDSSINASGEDHVMWSFRKAPGFFDVVTYTGSGSAQTISHNLDSVPGMIIVKCTSHGSTDWTVYHRETGHPAYGPSSYATFLNTSGTADPSASYWNNTDPTSTVFTVGSGDRTNGNGKTYVAYLFAHDEQLFGTNSDEAIIKCGSYTGTGGSGLNVNLGFEPQFVLVKNTDNPSAYWVVSDTMRGMTDNSRVQLYANNGDSEVSTTSNHGIFPTPTGFASNQGIGSFNESGSEHIYMAIRRPHKPPTDATEVFNAVQTTSQPFSVGFPTDLHINTMTGAGTASRYWVPRLTNNYMSSTSELYETAGSSYFEFDLQNSFSTGTWWIPDQNINWQFRRAPGFFDVVGYTGSGSPSGSTISHGLGVVPELLIVKRRDNGNAPWEVYSSVTGNGARLRLNTDGEKWNTSTTWQSTTPTSTEFYVSNSNNVGNDANNYVAYLFASLDGISKIGSYTGTGSDIDVNCGFSAGARFVLIKRTDSTGDWYVWDTTRGIVSNNDDPYLLFNSTAAQVTSTDYIDPLNAGFTVNSNAPAALNASGGTYLFFAIA